MIGRHTQLIVMLAAVALLEGCGTSGPGQSHAASPTAAPSVVATPNPASTPARTAIPPTTSPLEGVPDPAGRIAFGRYTRYDDFFGPLAQLFAIDPDGSDLLQLTTDDMADPRWSRDGRTLAFTVPRPDGSWQLATIPAAGGPMTVLTTGTGMSELASWGPDGTWLVYDYSPTVGGPGFHNVLYRINADGTNPRLLGNPDTWDVEAAVSPDGTKVAFLRLNANAEQGTIWIRDIATGKERQLEAAGADVEIPSWSPDGQWIMYGRDLTLLRVAADGSGTAVVIVDRATTPRAYKGSFAPDGRHILFGCDRSGADAICIANADGSGITPIADLPGYVEHWSDWGPVAP